MSDDWMGVTVYGPPELATGFLEHARTAGFTDSATDFCEMRHGATGARLDFAPVPAGYPDTIRDPRQWTADLRALALFGAAAADVEVRKAAARVLAVLSPHTVTADYLRTKALREAGCTCTPGRLQGGPKAHAEDLTCPVHKEPG